MFISCSRSCPIKRPAAATCPKATEIPCKSPPETAAISPILCKCLKASSALTPKPIRVLLACTSSSSWKGVPALNFTNCLKASVPFSALPVSTFNCVCSFSNLAALASAFTPAAAIGTLKPIVSFCPTSLASAPKDFSWLLALPICLANFSPPTASSITLSLLSDIV